jgi:hypothetical protein
MTRLTTATALAALAIAAAPAAAQQPVAPATPYVNYPQAYTYARPGVTYYAPARDNRAVLPSFAPRGGIGTTPFLGNTRGLGGYSVNYDAAPRPRAARPARRGLFFRRDR